MADANACAQKNFEMKRPMRGRNDLPVVMEGNLRTLWRRIKVRVSREPTAKINMTFLVHPIGGAAARHRPPPPAPSAQMGHLSPFSRRPSTELYAEHFKPPSHVSLVKFTEFTCDVSYRRDPFSISSVHKITNSERDALDALSELNISSTCAAPPSFAIFLNVPLCRTNSGQNEFLRIIHRPITIINHVPDRCPVVDSDPGPIRDANLFPSRFWTRS
ncbi:hypothetical protein EVAR_5611_1 [Eumeta japonica]|uniref:Uncharacterized protein n=1 Tax=Eumeta variegata TaxID=151549 RepID=A0A4C1U1P9_EUMVA|nr:hypothetical protein EVAR_5611_1 [Eumeta japonica]